MSRVRLIPMGVGEAFSTRHYTTCLALGVDDSWLLIDCPHPIRKMLREGSIAAGLATPLDIEHFTAVVVTHLHADHACGLEDYGYYSRIALGRCARIFMHPDASARLWNGLLAAGMGLAQLRPDAPPLEMHLDNYFTLEHLDTTHSVSCGPFQIECRRTFHSVPTFALRVTAAGRTFGFSADSAYDPGLIDWLSTSDLIVHEATNLRESTVHTPYEKLAALPQPLRNKMRLSHLPDDFDTAASAIDVLHQGQVYEI